MLTKKAWVITLFIIITFGAVGLYHITQSASSKKHSKSTLTLQQEENEKGEGGVKRRIYEWKMLRNPKTNKIPKDAFLKEAELLTAIKVRQSKANFRPSVNNTYNAAGPSQNGGRTRAVAYDMRNNGVMLAAGISGGIFRSTNGGSTWSFVHPPVSNPANSTINNIRNVSCFAQDPRVGFQDTWYAGTGELLGVSPAYGADLTLGHGVYKSTDNGLTWAKLAATASGNAIDINSTFDMVFNIQVDASGNVFAALLNEIVRSTDGGTSWSAVLQGSNFSQSLLNMTTDIAISKTGSRYIATFSGRNTARGDVGVWISNTGAGGSWIRVAGGVNGQADSVAGWKAYNNSLSSGNYVGGWDRTIIAISPSNPNVFYVMYQNALSAASGQPEADLFRGQVTTYPTVSWSANRGNNLRALQDGTTNSFMEVQEGYNMLLAVHPTLENLVIAGGVNLYKSTDGFTTNGTFIGGEESSTYSDPTVASHVDFHSFAFHPSTTNRLVVGSDGGLAVTNDITAATVAWSGLNSQYQTMQYYHIAIDPTINSLVFAGGAQDNSTTYRDAKGILGPTPSDPSDQYVGIVGGDGGMTALAASTASQQYMYGSFQNGGIFRFLLSASPTGAVIKPTAAGEGEFITYFHLDPDNTDNLYYVSFDSIWRTTNATTVSSASGWTLLSGVPTALNTTGESIFALATTRGTYNAGNSQLFIGTDAGKIYRLADPRNTAAATLPVNITPASLVPGSLVREIAVNPRNADTVLAVVSNYGVASAFWTGNALSASPTWQLVEGNIAAASFRSCAIVTTAAGVEYYVGTSIGLFSTTTINAGSTSWTLEGTAVMQGAIVNDLALRTADNTLLVGTHGNGMFYTNIGNVPTSVPDVVLNDKRFITAVFPTVVNSEINFRTGTLTGIRNINIRVTSMSGQVLLQKTQGYQTGSLQLGNLSTGTYLLEIWSDDRKFKHLQQFVKAK